MSVADAIVKNIAQGKLPEWSAVPFAMAGMADSLVSKLADLTLEVLKDHPELDHGPLDTVLKSLKEDGHLGSLMSVPHTSRVHANTGFGDKIGASLYPLIDPTLDSAEVLTQQIEIIKGLGTALKHLKGGGLLTD